MPDVPPAYKNRKWLALSDCALASSNGTATASTSFTVMSYNILCQKLIKRNLFKYASKNSLRWKSRKRLIINELSYFDADIMCLQEVGTEDWNLEYRHHLKVTGYQSRFLQSIRKSHGVVIAWKPELFYAIEEASVNMDRSMEVCGERLNTDNVALLMVLGLGKAPAAGSDGKQAPGIIVSSTHLFWKPAACYERLQQQVALLRAIRELQEKYPGYPVISCGDYNTTPDDAGYFLLTQPRPVALNEWQLDNLLPQHADDAKDKTDTEGDDKSTASSALSYASMAAAGTAAEPEDVALKRRKLEEEEKLAEELLQHDTELAQNLVQCIQADYQPMRSCYSTYTDLDPTYHTDQWKGEPIYTNYTAWKGTLDYIFYTPDRGLVAREIMSLPKKTEMDPGLPNETFGSDHLSILARFDFSMIGSL
ncbi:RNA exonuclease ngl2 [Coemansia sp. Benny D115]|nr:RNA exonuclease ngl2 [Coemansia sp. Benny D115]